MRRNPTREAQRAAPRQRETVLRKDTRNKHLLVDAST